MKKGKLSVPVFILFFVLASCQDDPSQVATNIPFKNASKVDKEIRAFSADSSVLLELKTADSVSIYYTIHIESSTNKEVNGKNIENKGQVDLGVQALLKKDSIHKYYVFSLKYDRFKLHARNGETEADIDAATAASSVDPSEKIFSVLNGLEITSIISYKGALLSISGINELKEKLQALSEGDRNSRAAINLFSKFFLENDFLKNMVRQTYSTYPLHPVKVGDSWTNNDTISSVFKLPVKTAYTLESVDAGVATIRSGSSINMDNQSVTVEGYNVIASVEATEQKKDAIDMASGLVLAGKNELKLSGTMSVLDKNVPVQMNVQTEIVGQKR